MEFGKQLKTLLKKNLLLKGKSKCSICCEVVFPLVIIGVLFAILALIKITDSDYNTIDASTFSRRVNPENILLYGSSNGSLNSDQSGVIDMMKEQVATIRGLPLTDVESFFMEINNRSAMETYFKNNSNIIYGGVWFNSSELVTPGNQFEYNIRLDSDDTADTSEIKSDGGDSGVYLNKNFASIQVAMDQAIFGYFGLDMILNISGRHYPNPYTEVWQEWILGRDVIIKSAGSVFITAALMMFSFRLVTDVVIEKETKILEAMKMMSLNPLAYFTSWIITSLTTSLPVTLIIAVVFKGSQLIYSTGWGTIILTFVLYLFTLLLLSFIFSIFFNNSKFCGLLSFVIVLAINIAGVFVSKNDFSVHAKLLLSIFSPIAFSNSIYCMSVKDLTMVLNLNWDYVVTENQSIMMLGIDIGIYIILIWYLEKVIPGEYGTKEKFYFLFTKKYWKSTKRSNNEIDDIESTYDSEDVETIPLKVLKNSTISIRNLRKEFETGDGLRVAVNDLYLDMFEGQIHALLGPNGCGKSTTIGMLTGLISPTNGSAFIHGYDITSQMSKIRPYIGCCLQTDIIWPQLTVLEHLCIYASLKGVKSRNIQSEAERMATEVGLEEKFNAPAGSLSGGQKRKLCLGIAFIGRSNIIFLDEVTSGMDPVSRRSVWDFLLKYKKGKTIILTTHYLEEADYLGDRIAIISQGKLRCDGTSLFLKNRFGQGYLLTCNKKLENSHNFNTQTVTDFVRNYIPSASILTDAGAELSYRLPTESLPNFPEFFAHFDENISRFGISTYGISVTSLEEVFISLGQVDDKNLNNQIEARVNEMAALKHAIATPSVGISQIQQLKGLLIKRIQQSKKDARSFFLSIILPMALIVGSIVLYKTMSDQQQVLFYNNSTIPLTMSLSMYSSYNIVVPMQSLNSESNWSYLFNDSTYFNQFIYVPESIDFNDYLIDNYKLSAGAINFTNQIGANDSISGQPTCSYVSYYNTDYIHSFPIHVNLVNDALLRNHTNIGIQVTSMPFDHILTAFEISSSDINASAIIYFVFILMAGFSLMSGSFAGSIAQERTNRVKRLLYVSGCKKHIYWLSNLIWDLFFALFISILTCGIIAGVIKGAFKDQFGAFFLCLLSLSMAIIPLGYLFSYKFQTYGKAVGAITAILFVFGLVFSIVSLNVRLQAVINQNTSTQKAADIVDIIFSVLSPIFALNRVVFILSGFPGSTRLGTFKIDDYWTFDYLGTPLVILAGHAIIWTSWILILDYIPQIKGFFKNPKNLPAPSPPEDEDYDVTQERRRLLNMKPFEEPIQFKNLHKLFPGSGKNPPKTAVFNSTLGIPRGQTFGLLGLNGGGKSTTLSMLSGEIVPSSGEISINGYDVITNREKALGNISMVFQFDALISLLSAREHLWLFSRIKGIKESEIENCVEAFIKMVDLTRIANSGCGGYSGGNKRKVSLSMAMLGNPSVVFLDEISCGCDAVVRRQLWDVISELGKDKSIILTSHSMSEVEALCSRITIMKEGKYTCLNTIQGVKNRFGAGYSIDVKFKKQFLESGIQTILQTIPNSTVLDQHDVMASFEVPNPPENPIKLSNIFSILSSLTILDDYNVGQTSLESVFLKLTGANHDQRVNLYD
ncbi:hypothetical protein RB653_005070 [Dictyostelium firmibasis]|uniref:ABC transporter domain-containing protein n=1 Tax=Dictyostelium firmibasis TaxID=79012 RepID=A0AAN7YSQ5_9MYCE